MIEADKKVGGSELAKSHIIASDSLNEAKIQKMEQNVIWVSRPMSHRLESASKFK